MDGRPNRGNKAAFSNFSGVVERLSVECRKTKTKVITL